MRCGNDIDKERSEWQLENEPDWCKTCDVIVDIQMAEIFGKGEEL